LIKPAVISVYPTINMQSILDVKLWHGFTTEIWMSIGIIVLGTVLYFYRVTYKKVYLVLPPSFSLDHLYDQMLEEADNVAKSMINCYMTHEVRDYFAYIFICFIVLMGVSLFSLNAFSVSFQQDQQMTVFTWIIESSVVSASVTILLTTSR